VHHAECLAIMTTYSNFKSTLARDLVSHHPAHFQTSNFSANNAMLNDDVGPTFSNQIYKRQMSFIYWRLVSQWFCWNGLQFQ
jgi:hypothetical protein